VSTAHPSQTRANEKPSGAARCLGRVHPDHRGDRAGRGCNRTAWSGYQAAKWDGQQSLLYGTASADRFQADAASAAFARGTTARDNADSYVRDTVLFAAVLFLVAITQRFKLRNIRIATTAVAFALLIYTAVSVAQLPRT